LWASVSAFSVSHLQPDALSKEREAFTTYLGSVEAGRSHDATVLLSEQSMPLFEFDDILIDQGTGDEFLVEQLKPEAFAETASKHA
jgi:hypothetical protein